MLYSTLNYFLGELGRLLCNEWADYCLKFWVNWEQQNSILLSLTFLKTQIPRISLSVHWGISYLYYFDNN